MNNADYKEKYSQLSNDKIKELMSKDLAGYEESALIALINENKKRGLEEPAELKEIQKKLALEVIVQKQGPNTITLRFLEGVLDYSFKQGKSFYPNKIPYTSIYLDEPSIVHNESKWNRNFGIAWILIGLYRTFETGAPLAGAIWFVIGTGLLYVWRKDKISLRVFASDVGNLQLLEDGQVDTIVERIREYKITSQKQIEERSERAFKDLFLGLMAEMILCDEKITEEEVVVASRAYTQLLGEEMTPVQFQIFLEEFGQRESGLIVQELKSAANQINIQWHETIIRVCYHLMICDGEVTDVEKKLLQEYGQALGLTPVHFNGIINAFMQSQRPPDDIE